MSNEIKVDTENLPVWENGTNKGRINWNKSIGYNIIINYNCNEYKAVLIDYDKKKYKITIMVCGKEYSIKLGDFIKGKIGHMISDNFDKKTRDNVFYDNDLERNAKGIIWRNNVGKVVKILYNNNIYEFKIMDYTPKTKRIILEYNGEICKPISITTFLNCQIGNIIGEVTIDFKINIGHIFKDDKRNIVILDREYRDRSRKNRNTEKEKWYKYRCLVCENEDWMEESGLLTAKHGCNVCCTSPQKITEYNCLATKRPDLVKYLVDKNDGYKYTPSSNKKVKCKCVDCGYEKETALSKLNINGGVSCKKCGDGIPYTERLMLSVLEYLNIQNIKTQYYNADWGIDRYYDFYFNINGKSVILETHGRQHYIEINKKGRGRSLKEEQLNDKYKKEVALKNGIDYYIEIDCRESSLEWIKESIISSELGNLLNLTNINWNNCDERSQKNKVLEASKLFNNAMTATKISVELGISLTTTVEYLKKATKLGWCNYTLKKDRKTHIKNQ